MALKNHLNVSNFCIKNFLKSEMKIMKPNIKYYKKLFEAIKKRSKKNHFSILILTFKNNIKKTWEIIKDSIGK